MPEVSVSFRATSRTRGRRGVSGLGILLVVIGALVLLVSFSILPSTVYELWPVILIALGLLLLYRRWR
jgi:hypothetical protein